MASKTPDITLYFLQASRSIRIAWLLELLQLPYKLCFFDRENNKAPASFKATSGNALGKAPALRDGDLLIVESGAICDCLCETYDTTGILTGGADQGKRTKIRQWVHAAEGTFMPHCLAITYARWNATERMKRDGDLAEMERGLAVNVQKDLRWLDDELAGGLAGKFLVGDEVTAADAMVVFSVQFIFVKNLCGGQKREEYGNVDRWLMACEATETWKRAVEKSGYVLQP